MRSYLPRLISRIEDLKQSIAEHGASPVCINDIMRWHSFDVMGDLGFSQEFDMVRSDKERPLLVKLDKSLQFQAWLTPAVWLMRLVFIAAYIYAYFFPKSNLNDWFAMTQFTQNLIESRAKASIFHAFLASVFTQLLN